MEVVKWLEHLPAKETVTVIPNSTGINFAAGRVDPLPYTDFDPSSLVMFGETNIVAAF